MKRVSASQINDGAQPAARQPMELTDIGGQLQQALAALDDIYEIRKEQQAVVSDLKAIGSRLTQIEAMANQSSQYQRDHDQLHRSMDAMYNENQDSVQKALRDAIESSNSMISTFMASQDDAQRGHLMAVVDAVTRMTAAMDAFANKDIDVRVEQGNQEIVVKPESDTRLREYDIVRGNNGLISKVKEITR
jgi:hypothetical protein